MEDNSNRQADEIEALSAIFGNQVVIDEQNEKKFVVSLVEGEGIHKQALTLQVEFENDYPSSAPPTYNIKHSTFSNCELERLSNLLNEIYLDNLGASIVYLWIDKIKEMLHAKSNILVTASDENSTEVVVDDDDCVGGKEDGCDYSEQACDNSEDFNVDYYHFHKEAAKSKEEGKCLEMLLPPIHHGEFVRDRKSVFQGHLAPVTDKKQVDMVMDKLKENKKIATATHNIIAYRIDCNNGGFMTGCRDDGEIHASSRMLHLLEIVDARNVLIVVTRWYGGVHLGPDRFKHINNCTRDLLEKHGYISEKSNNKAGQKGNSTESSNPKVNVKNKRH